MTPKERFIHDLLSQTAIPKCSVHVRDIVDVENECAAQCKSDEQKGTHEIHMMEEQFGDFARLISTVTHEAIHAAMHDILATLNACGVLNDELVLLLTERAANAGDSVMFEVLTNYETHKRAYERVMIQGNNCPASATEHGLRLPNHFATLPD